MFSSPLIGGRFSSLLCDTCPAATGGGAGTADSTAANQATMITALNNILAEQRDDIQIAEVQVVDANDLVLFRRTIVNQNTGVPTVSYVDANNIPQTPTLPLKADTSIVEQTLTAEGLTVSTIAVGLPTIPATANKAIIHVWNDSIVYRLDGTNPTITDGIRSNDGATITLTSRDEIIDFRAIRLNATDSFLHIQYINQ